MVRDVEVRPGRVGEGLIKRRIGVELWSDQAVPERPPISLRLSGGHRRGETGSASVDDKSDDE